MTLPSTSIPFSPVLGALVSPGKVEYRAWAPDHAALAVRIRRGAGSDARLELAAGENGYFFGADREGRAGDRYRFELPDGSLVPDIASRFQPDGVHGESECVSPRSYRWGDGAWRRPPWRNPVIYELHVGTFTAQGTFQAAIERLDHVRSLGVTAIELMPVAEFAGRRNWGYDGTFLYAPAHVYGRPDDLRALVDAAHQRGLAVILDVVYNHPGPEGSYFQRFTARYFNPAHHTPWGPGFNFDGESSRAVRDFFVRNAVYWLEDFHIDGLRLDATHAIQDDSPRHILCEIADKAHVRGAFVVAEDERNEARLVAPDQEGGFGLDALWADDFHHQVRVALTGIRTSYFGSFSGTAEDIVRTLEEGWFYRGQNFPFRGGEPRGTPGRHLAANRFVVCIENHDQVGNRARGERLEHLVDPPAFRAASLLLCLCPYPPLLFMGQEWGAGTPFLFFTDYPGELGWQVTAGRQKEMARDESFNAQAVPDPQAEATFRNSVLRWEELGEAPHAEIKALYQACLRERASWEAGATDRENWSAYCLGHLIAIRYRSRTSTEKLVLAALTPGNRPAWQQDARLGPPPGRHWRVAISSDGMGAEKNGTWPAAEALDFTKPLAALLVAKG